MKTEYDTIYDTLPKVCGMAECMMTTVEYIGDKPNSNWQKGNSYIAKWKADRYFNGKYNFKVIQKVTTGINSKGKERVYHLVIPYESPEAILRDWNFKDLRKWKESLTV